MLAAAKNLTAIIITSLAGKPHGRGLSLFCRKTETGKPSLLDKVPHYQQLRLPKKRNEMGQNNFFFKTRLKISQINSAILCCCNSRHVPSLLDKVPHNDISETG